MIKQYIISYMIIFLSGFWNSPVPSHRNEEFFKGMTISCQTWGYEWATPEMRETMVELKSLGVNWISIHPYARIRESGSVSHRKSKSSDYIRTPLNWGKELNINVMIKPHLAYWGTKFSWRGEIDFTSDSDWQLFFRDYTAWILELAKLAEEGQSQVFCIGTELTHSLPFKSDWRSLIKKIRGVYSGKLTYAANWNSYREVTFWDDLDYIGIQAYFPLSKEEYPSEYLLNKGWDNVFEEIESYAEKQNKKVIFTEIGYDVSNKAASEPWLSQRSSEKQARQLQETCLKIALSRTAGSEYLSGIFLWKWFPETQKFHHYEDYNLQTPEIKDLIKSSWQ